MKIVTRTSLGFRTQRIVFTDAEVRTLTRAAAIAEQARDLASSVQPAWEDYEDDTTLAEIEHGCREILGGVEVSDEEIASGLWVIS